MDTGRNQRTFHGKILVFGEYSIIEWPWAVLLPYTKVGASLAFPRSPDAHTLRSNLVLKDFSLFLSGMQNKGPIPGWLNIEQLNEDLEQGLYLQSDFPENYGLGSSGALCAAIYETYGNKKLAISPAALLEIFALMESYFHGSSSGVDPLSIYLGEPLVIQNGAYFFPGSKGDFKKNAVKMFLIDTGLKSLTAPLVKVFRDSMLDRQFRRKFTRDYFPLMKCAIEQWVDGKLTEQTILSLSLAQQQLFLTMIPASYYRVWCEGMDTGLYALKLCGSGGGGMLLGFSANIDATRAHLLQKYKLQIEVLTE